MNIYYWCPFLSKVATIQAVLNSADSLKKYSKNKISPHIINAVGEWYQFEHEIEKKNIKLINFTKTKKLYEMLPRYSYLKSRCSYLIICFFSFFKLYKFLKARNENDIFLIHLISSLPLLMILFFNFECKFILRISGYPKLNFFRKLLWKLCEKKLSFVLCPTKDTKKNLVFNKIFSKDIFHVLYDPVLKIKEFNNLRKEKVLEKFENKEFLINIGRLTKQKNQFFLLKAFNEILKTYPNLNLIILGEGELKEDLIKMSKDLSISEKIIFLGHVENVFKYLYKAKLFVLTSNYEDPGFVLLEAAFSRALILSANCPNGPTEILQNNLGGYLYETNNLEDFMQKFKKSFLDDPNSKFEKKLNVLKYSKNFTAFRHFQNFKFILNKFN